MRIAGESCAAPEFLSPTAELLATPAPRVARGLLLTLIAALASLLAWAALAKVDVIARAPGRLLPAQGSHAIQPQEAGRVTAIRVRDGQRVRAGEVLLEIDRSAAATAQARLAEELVALDLERWRLRSLLDMTAAVPVSRAATPPLAGDGARRQRDEELAEWRSTGQAAAAQARAARAELLALDARLDGLRAALPLQEETTEAHRRLAAQGMLARVAWLAEERTRIAARREIAELVARRGALRDARVAAAAQVEAERSARRAGWSAQLAQVATRAAQVAAEIAHAQQRVSSTSLRAPVAGSVWRIDPALRPGVVAPAEPLLLLVPEDAGLEATVDVANRDIAAVHVGQRAWIKIDAFPFTRHGALAGRVTAVARDAHPGDDGNAHYRVRIALRDTARDHRLPTHLLVAGMTVTAELRLGRRRILDFLLAPLQRTALESLRER